MLKALLRKQFLELTTWFYQDKKTGKNRSKAAMAGFIILYAVICACCCMIFFVVGGSLCGPLLAVDMGWLYMAIMGLIAMALGVFGSVFNTYAGLYRSRIMSCCFPFLFRHPLFWQCGCLECGSGGLSMRLLYSCRQ